MKKRQKDKKAAPERDPIILCGAAWARQPTKLIALCIVAPPDGKSKRE